MRVELTSVDGVYINSFNFLTRRKHMRLSTRFLSTNLCNVFLLLNMAFPLLAVKHDCVFGDDLNLDEISFVSQV